MFYVTPLIVIFAVILVFFTVKKNQTTPLRTAAGVTITIIGTLSLCAVSFFGILKIVFMGGFLESPAATPGEYAVAWLVFSALMLVSAAAVVFGLSLFTGIMKEKKLLVLIMTAWLIFPAMFGIIIGLGNFGQNIDLKGVFRYFSSKKFSYGPLRWNMNKSEAMNILREGYATPPDMTCGISGRIAFMRYNFNNKLYEIEAAFDTKTKKEQEGLISCLTAKYGKPLSGSKGVQCGCYYVKWKLPETNIVMIVYDEEMTGELYRPPFSSVNITYTFWPQYLRLKQGFAWEGR